MRSMTNPADQVAAEIAGTTIGDRLIVTAWRGGNLVAGPLNLVAWTMDWDATRSVQGQATFTIADPDGLLAPWALTDPLAPAGTRLHVEYELGISGTRIPLGVWRIRKADPQETWRTYRHGDQRLRIIGGGQITLTADEETCSLLMDRLDPGARVPKENRPLSEVAYLASEYLATSLAPGVTDTKAIPPSLVYEEDRLGAIEDLLQIAGCAHRMTGEGNLEILPEIGTNTGWIIDGGEEGALINLTRSLSDEGLYNAAISTGTGPDQTPLLGRAYLTSGPLTRGGPFGTVPIFHQGIATDQPGITRDAETLLSNRQTKGEVELQIECLAHPAIQPHDLVTIVAATTAGESPIKGRVVTMSLVSANTEAGPVPAKRMNLTVKVNRDALETIKRNAH